MNFIKKKKKSLYSTTICLNPGTYQFKYLVDGRWKIDPNEDYKENSYGSYNNIVEVFPKVFDIDSDDDPGSETESEKTYDTK